MQKTNKDNVTKKIMITLAVIMSVLLLVLIGYFIITTVTFEGQTSKKQVDQSKTQGQMIDSQKNKIENHIKENISSLSPVKEVLGGNFYVTGISYIDDERLVIEYEDGHKAYKASANFSLENNEPMIYNFSLLEDGDETGELEKNNWDLIKTAVTSCQAEEVMQTHSQKVSVKLKNGRTIDGVEPNIDDIIDLAVASQEKCGKILMATE